MRSAVTRTDSRVGNESPARGAGAPTSTPSDTIDLGTRLSIVVLTFNRARRVLDTLGRLHRLPEGCPVLLVDNGSTDHTSDLVRHHFPAVRVIRLHRNLGAAGRNYGVQAAGTPYVAFCDDDTWWAEGALPRAVELLDAHPRIAALSARVLVGPAETEDPACLPMARSPLPSAGLPGPALLGFLAGACVMRREVFLAAGGYEPRLFLGAEEQLLAWDLAARGWAIVYASAVIAHHHPAPRTDTARRRRLVLRNAAWIAWLRRPATSALRASIALLREARERRCSMRWLLECLLGMTWVVRRRRVLPPPIEAWIRLLETRPQPAARRSVQRQT